MGGWVRAAWWSVLLFGLGAWGAFPALGGLLEYGARPDRPSWTPSPVWVIPLHFVALGCLAPAVWHSGPARFATLGAALLLGWGLAAEIGGLWPNGGAVLTGTACGLAIFGALLSRIRVLWIGVLLSGYGTASWIASEPASLTPEGVVIVVDPESEPE